MRNKKLIMLLANIFLIFGMVSCNSSKKEEVEVHTHTYSEFISAKESTCVENGYIGHYECLTCHKYFDPNLNEIEDISLPLLDHKLGNYVPGYNATCTLEGLEGYKQCESCHQYFDNNGNVLSSIVINKKEHSLVLHQAVEASCFGEGTIEYYSCNNCEKLFDSNFNEITNITTSKIGSHNYDSNDVCLTCGLKKGVVSVSEAYTKTYDDSIFNITAKVVGVTSSYGSGYLYVILKDLVSNDMIGIRKQVAKDNLDNEERKFGTGTSSYNPTMLFEMGDIVELPVTKKLNTATKGGNKGLTYLIYRGTSIENYESSDAFLEEVVIDHDDNFEINIDKYITVIDSQEDIDNYTKDGGKQWQIVVFKGTETNPLKFVTSSTESSNQFGTSYIFPYYNDATKRSDFISNDSYVAFSNFANKYNLSSDLSTLLFNQTEYKASDFTNPYLFKGEIYAVMVGGSTYYYHMTVLSNSCIKNDNALASSSVSASVAKSTFYKAMEKKASELGISLHKSITSAVGVSGTVCTEDLCRIGIAMTRSPKASIFWGKDDYIGTWKSNTNEIVTGDLYSKTYASEEFRTYIENEFGEGCFIGSKGGSLKATSSRSYPIQTSILALKGPDNTILVGATNSSISSDIHLDAIKYQEIGKAFKILIARYNNDEALATQIEATLDCHAVAAVMLPATDAPANGYDWWGENSTVLSYSKNGKDIITTASAWKTMTCITALDYVDETDMQTEILVEKTELNSITNSALPKYKGGEVVTLEVAFYSMLRHSSNVSPAVIARYVGEKIYKANNGL